MKTQTLTLRLSLDLDARLEAIAKSTGRSKSEIARDALRKQLAIETLREIRRDLVPAAESQGIVTDEDVFDLGS